MNNQNQGPPLQRTPRSRRPSSVAEEDISVGSFLLEDLSPGASETALRPSAAPNGDRGRSNTAHPESSPRTPQASVGDDQIAGLSTPSLPALHHNNRCALLQKEFNTEKQFWKLFRGGLEKFTITLVLAILLLSAIYMFSSKPVMNRKWKRWFNAINTGISLALGMSVANGLKSMVVDLRWFILSRKQRRLSEVDLILRADSLAVMFQLSWITCKKKTLKNGHKRDWALLMTCISLLLVNLVSDVTGRFVQNITKKKCLEAAQIAVATVGLNYSTEENQVIALLEPGTVLLPDLRQIYPISDKAHDSIRAQQYTANGFGRVASRLDVNYTATIPAPGRFWNTGADLFLADDENSWVFVFLDSPPGGVGLLSSIYTNRTINSTWSCQSWLILSGGNGTMGTLTAELNSSGAVFNVSLPTIGGPNQTTYFTDPDTNCGPGCSIIEAFEASLTHPWFYHCNVTVGVVKNSRIPEHEADPGLRKMASAGIALHGYGSPPGAKQAQIYSSESLYGQPQGGNAEAMGRLISRFSIGVVSEASLLCGKNNFTVPGMQPSIGSQLVVDHWIFIWLIIGLLVGIQGAAFVLTAFWANRVLVKDQSFLSVATLFKPFIEKLENRGTAARGWKICEALDEEPDSEVIYRATERMEGGRKVRQLKFGSSGRDRTFKEGLYY